MSNPQAHFIGDSIHISHYPFRPVLFKKTVQIAARDIEEVDLVQCVLRVKHELIYLPGWPREALRDFCLAHGVVIRKRYDVWADVLEPYVDTSYTALEVKARNSRLRAAQFSSGRVFKLRLLYGPFMVLYQGIAGEWAGLYLYDLLLATRILRWFGLYGMIYRHTMDIALEPYQQSWVDQQS